MNRRDCAAVLRHYSRWLLSPRARETTSVRAEWDNPTRRRTARGENAAWAKNRSRRSGRAAHFLKQHQAALISPSSSLARLRYFPIRTKCRAGGSFGDNNLTPREHRRALVTTPIIVARSVKKSARSARFSRKPPRASHSDEEKNPTQNPDPTNP